MARRARKEAVVLGRSKGSRPQQQELDPRLSRSIGSREGRRHVQFLLAARRRVSATAVTELVRALPRDTFLETAVAAFRDRTDIPLELPLGAGMAMINAHVLRSGASLDLRGQRVSPALWTVVLAPSGGGKTFAIDQLMAATGADLERFPEPGSAAQFVDALQRHNRSLWIRDEFGQFLANMQNQKHCAELRDYMLRLYDGGRIERHTLKHSVTVDEPALTLFAAQVSDTWHDCRPADALLDGFAQRFNFILARSEREVIVPIYDLSPWYARLRETWRWLTVVPLAPTYAVGDEAIGAFEAVFHAFHGGLGGAMPRSFFRRTLFAGLRYALVYHVLRGKTQPCLDAADVAWAAQMVWRHLCDSARMLEPAGLSDLSHRLERVRRVVTKARERGAVVAPRDVQQATKFSAAEARALLELALEGDPAATPAERERAAGVGRR